MICLNNTIKNLIKIFVAILVMCALIFDGDSATEGAKKAIDVCLMSVVPSLLPFMVVSGYIIRAGLFSFNGKIADKVFRFIFSLPGQTSGIFIMSLVGGYPVGATLISQSVKNGLITKNQGKRMMLFCVNPGPAFVINIVGAFTLNNKKAGWILLISLCLASVVTGVATKIFNSEDPDNKVYETNNNLSSLTASVSEGVTAVLGVCGWIIVFGALLGVLNNLPLSENSRCLMNMIAEVTVGSKASASSFPLPVTAFVLGFSGLAVHGQLLTHIACVGLKYRYFLVSRLFTATVSMGIAWLLFKIFPCQVSVFSNAGEIIPQGVSVSASATAGMLFLSALIILDLAPKRKM